MADPKHTRDGIRAWCFICGKHAPCPHITPKNEAAHLAYQAHQEAGGWKSQGWTEADLEAACKRIGEASARAANPAPAPWIPSSPEGSPEYWREILEHHDKHRPPRAPESRQDAPGEAAAPREDSPPAPPPPESPNGLTEIGKQVIADTEKMWGHLRVQHSAEYHRYYDDVTAPPAPAPPPPPPAPLRDKLIADARAAAAETPGRRHMPISPERAQDEREREPPGKSEIAQVVDDLSQEIISEELLPSLAAAIVTRRDQLTAKRNRIARILGPEARAQRRHLDRAHFFCNRLIEEHFWLTEFSEMEIIPVNRSTLGEARNDNNEEYE